MNNTRKHDLIARLRFFEGAKRGMHSAITDNFVGIIISTSAGNFEATLDLRELKPVFIEEWFMSPMFLVDPGYAIKFLAEGENFKILKAGVVGEGVVMKTSEMDNP